MLGGDAERDRVGVDQRKLEDLGPQDGPRHRSVVADRRKHVRKARMVRWFGIPDFGRRLDTAPRHRLRHAPEAHEAGHGEHVADRSKVGMLLEDERRHAPFLLKMQKLRGGAQGSEPDDEVERVPQRRRAHRREPQEAERRHAHLESPADPQAGLGSQRTRPLDDRDVDVMGKARLRLRQVLFAEPEDAEKVVGRDVPVLDDLDEREEQAG